MTATQTMRIVDDIEVARATILKREPLSEPVLAEPVQSGIDELWGEHVSPADHVRRIIDAVRT
ncbi:MAG: hypothetical protein Q7K37_01365, partial [Dehalococcoidia bacterium]|nr:hypothetical protein [Dehalococcoidia bacterium]